jgi:acyl CoA:acetate/3-ketoacid CoA transferase beta subunit
LKPVGLTECKLSDERARDQIVAFACRWRGKFKPRCGLPLTGTNCVDLLITELGVFQRPTRKDLFRLIELAPGVTREEVRAHQFGIGRNDVYERLRGICPRCETGFV